MAAPSLTDLKIHLNKTTGADDDELIDMLDAAVDVVSSIIGTVSPGPVTETHYGVASPLLVLQRAPVSSVESIASSYLGSSPATIAPSSYVLDPATGIVRLRTGGAFWGDVTVTYTAGSDDMPASVRLAILIIAAHLFETQRMPGYTSDAPAGFGGSDGVQDARPSGMGFAIPSRAQELLQPYMRPVIA